MGSEQLAGRAAAGSDLPVVRGPRGRLARRLWTVVTASDPGLERLRSAGTTVGSLLVALGLLYGLVTVWGQPVTSAVLGVLVAMIASIAVNEPTPNRRAATIALLVPCAAASAGLATELSPWPVIADVGFVAVSIGAVFLRLLGPRGLAMGMIGFIAYFLALFVQVTVGQLPVAIVSAAVGALVSVGVGFLLRPRHPDRDLRRMLSALGVRAGSVLEALSRECDGSTAESRRAGRLQSRLAGCGETARLVEQRLDSAEERLLEGIDNDELSVRVFDLQLSVEHLVTVAAHVRVAELPAHIREAIVAALDRAGGVLQEGTGARSAARVGVLAAASSAGAPRVRGGQSVEQVDRLVCALQVTVTGWLQVMDPRPADAAAHHDDSIPDGPVDRVEGGATGDGDTGDDDLPPGRWADTARQAVQVGLAAALAIAVGELISSTRWFWAAIAAFVVFTGASTRGETLSKGWQRVLGTLAGVGAGVVVAALVGGNTVAALVLIVLSVFLGFYLMRISSGWMIFFITAMLALLYGLLGQFSVELLLVRLEETAAGAAIGVLVSFLVFPSSTRGAVRRGAGEFLTDLGELLEHLTTTLTGQRTTGSSAQAEASALRESFDSLKSTAKPLTEGLAGLANRSGYRRTLRVLGACEHHARVLARVADTAAGSAAADPDLCRALGSAVQGVRDNVDTVARAVDEGLAGVLVHPADAALDALDRNVDTARESDRHGLAAIGRQLRAIDQAVCGLATDRGARAQPLEGVR
ncbi:Uncharacterized membrane protein YccC [Modestobacter sp. DSM 44400]|uniref:FUSC family protein n=1 Tax=Modestobacter sp. DSM 44400 TaxID=1550230 RepID=UPI00089BD024|nr:FUSC family protein [Modestobacter sp. DSM 44400]SDX50259.1 Uncharacterized membrane protein YccC [Modestobacter sp. DSM 44400]